MASKPEHCCNFCGKTRHEVRIIIAGPSVYICDACVNVCKTIIDRQLQQEGEPKIFAKPVASVQRIKVLLEDLKAEGVITQAEYTVKMREALQCKSTEVIPIVAEAKKRKGRK